MDSLRSLIVLSNFTKGSFVAITKGEKFSKMKMKCVVLLIFFQFSPVRVKGGMTPLEKAQAKRSSYEKMLQNAKWDIASTQAKYDQLIIKKQNYTNILEQEKARNDDLKGNYSELQRHYHACDMELGGCENRTQNNMAVYYHQQIQETEKRIQEVLREKNGKIPLSLKRKEEKEAALNQLNDEKSKLKKLKNEKERLLREIEQCQTVPESSTVLVPESSTVLVPESSTLSGSTCFLSNLIDYKSSFMYNLLSGLLGLARRKS